MERTIYELLPGTPERLEDSYSPKKAKEKQCKRCDVPKDLQNLIGYCDIGLCP